MSTPTFTITTPVDNKVVTLKKYITGREKRSLTNVFLNGDLQFSADAKDIKGLKGNLVELAEDLAIKTVVEAVDGIADNVVEAVLNMHANDYTFVITEINKVTNDQAGEEVKKN